MSIHATAIIDKAAQLDEGVTVGAFTVIGPHVQIGKGTQIGHHCVIEGHTTIGQDNHIMHFASLGAAPQDKKYKGEPTQLVIGDRNTIREFVTFNLGTTQDTGITKIGNDNWIMAYVHIAHDCMVGNHTIFANNSQLAGHVEVGDWVILGGFTGVHQFVKIGAHAFTAISSVVLQDIPPFVMAAGNTAEQHGINTEGLKRRGFSKDAITAIRAAHKTLYRSSLTLEEAKITLSSKLDEYRAANQVDVVPHIESFLNFLSQATRGIVR
ncbi:acyl-ACP--UDP-N-acetylglucosamine O-acyltransferase [Ampullimonas aquatilis]|uniref:acyl-ACP--UDP-N-acetylglucosamine O-acyltransferase n=1 Tax=Ampullimonas aquatilis TaxID=1341549 RepID=UPI003C71FD54